MGWQLRERVMNICSEENCHGKVVAFGMCDKHYRRWKATGSTEPSKKHQRHGMSNSKEYIAWQAMWARVKHPYKRSYCYEGIPICERWKVFVNFYEDMGKCPAGYTLERINSEKGYSPKNCRWASKTEQARNKSNNVLNEEIVEKAREMKSKGYTYDAIARKLGVNKITIYDAVVGRTWSETAS